MNYRPHAAWWWISPDLGNSRAVQPQLPGTLCQGWVALLWAQGNSWGFTTPYWFPKVLKSNLGNASKLSLGLVVHHWATFRSWTASLDWWHKSWALDLSSGDYDVSMDVTQQPCSCSGFFLCSHKSHQVLAEGAQVLLFVLHDMKCLFSALWCASTHMDASSYAWFFKAVQILLGFLSTWFTTHLTFGWVQSLCKIVLMSFFFFSPVPWYQF